MGAQAKYTESVEYYNKSLRIFQEIYPGNYRDLATSLQNIGGSLFLYGQIFRSTQIECLPSEEERDLVGSYNNNATLYHRLGQYRKALDLNMKTLDIWRNSSFKNHNINCMPVELAKYRTALHIRQKYLPKNHVDLAHIHNNMGASYRRMNEYSNALLSYKPTLRIRLKTLRANHPAVIECYNNVAAMSFNMCDYSKLRHGLSKFVLIKKYIWNHENIHSSAI